MPSRIAQIGKRDPEQISHLFVQNRGALHPVDTEQATGNPHGQIGPDNIGKPPQVTSLFQVDTDFFIRFPAGSLAFQLTRFQFPSRECDVPGPGVKVVCSTLNEQEFKAITAPLQYHGDRGRRPVTWGLNGITLTRFKQFRNSIKRTIHILLTNLSSLRVFGSGLFYILTVSFDTVKQNNTRTTVTHHHLSAIPRISILMPVRNEERYLQATLDSLFRQTCADWELVAVDDGSNDGTAAILDAAACKDRRVRAIRTEGKGLVSALNTGLKACRSALLARMDGDDICHPRRLELQSAYLETYPDIGLVACNFRHFPRTALKQGMIDYERWQNGLNEHFLIVRDLFIESPFVHPGIMTRRTIMKELGGYHDAGWPEDYDLWLRMAANGVRFARLPQTLLFWRDHPERATRTMHEYATDAFRACKCHYLLRGFLRESRDVVIAGAGQEARAWQRLLTEVEVTVSTWLDVDPRKIGRMLHGAPVISPDTLQLSGRKMIVAIGVRGAREQFRNVAKKRGWQEGIDFVCVA